MFQFSQNEVLLITFGNGYIVSIRHPESRATVVANEVQVMYWRNNEVSQDPGNMNADQLAAFLYKIMLQP